nr:tetratricopeptide repeat protein [Bradyrhizobium sp. BR 10289]
MNVFLNGRDRSRRYSVLLSRISDLPEFHNEASRCIRKLGLQQIKQKPRDRFQPIDLTAAAKLVDECDVLVLLVESGTFKPYRDFELLSIAKAQYERALELRRPIVVFQALKPEGADHNFEIKSASTEADLFVDRLTEHQEFLKVQTPFALRIALVESLFRLRTGLPLDESDRLLGHIPPLPRPFLPHGYALHNTETFSGRTKEIAKLDHWSPPAPANECTPVLVIRALGGMGKTALAWSWCNDRQETLGSDFEGFIWWSFYESDATFERFIVQALSYVSAVLPSDISKRSVEANARDLLSHLRQRRFLLCLDGLERIMSAYSEDTRQQEFDSFSLEEIPSQQSQTAHFDSRRFRECFDRRADAFLYDLTTCNNSRILITSRLYPAAFEGADGIHLRSVRTIDLEGLESDDAVSFAKKLGLKFKLGEFIKFAESIKWYPLGIRALAGAVVQSKSAQGSLSRWLAENPGFQPTQLSLVQRRNHVLSYATRELKSGPLFVLSAIAAFRWPPTFAILQTMVVGPSKTLQSISELDAALEELEDRGLVGWDIATYTFDVHPIVRGVVWHLIGALGQRIVIEAHESYFELDDSFAAQGMERNYQDLVQYYYVLLELGRHAEAFTLLDQNFFDDAVFRLGMAHIVIQMMEALFETLPEGSDAIFLPHDRAYAENNLGLVYSRSCLNDSAIKWFGSALGSARMHESSDDPTLITNLAESEFACGNLFRAYSLTLQTSDKAVSQKKRSHSLSLLGEILLRLGFVEHARAALLQALGAFESRGLDTESSVGITSLNLAATFYADNSPDLKAARRWAEHALRIAERSRISSLQIYSGIFLAELDQAELGSELTQERLLQLLEVARKQLLIGPECETIIALARTALRAKLPTLAVNYLQSIESISPVYRIVEPRAERMVLLAQAAQIVGAKDQSVEYASEAMRLAWCDGPPFALMRIVRDARAILHRCGVQSPSLPPFDQRILRRHYNIGFALPRELLS